MKETECTHRAECGREVREIGEGYDDTGHYTEMGSYCGCCGALMSTWRIYENKNLRGIHA